MSTVSMEPWLREILRCPACHAVLTDATAPNGGAELQCTGTCADGQRRGYRIEDGIPVLLIDEARVFPA